MPIEQITGEEASSDPARTLFESDAWRQVIKQTYDFTFYRAYERDGSGRAGEETVSLPFATTDSDLRARAVSLPFSDYVRTDGIDLSTYRSLAEVIRSAYPKSPLIFKTTYPHDVEAIGSILEKGYYHTVPTGSHEEVDQNMRSSFQRGVRKAKRKGVTIQRATTPEAMSVFYDLHRSLRFGKFGKIPQPRQFFSEIRRAFLEDEQGFVLQALRQETVIGALVALQHRGVLYYKFGASEEDALEYRPNNLLFHNLLHHAVDEGLRAVDLGFSGVGESYRGLRRFKESFGGERRPIVTFRMDPPGHDEAKENELDDLLGQLTETVVEQRLDAEATDAVSEILYPYFA
jgi:hypothetical protein